MAGVLVVSAIAFIAVRARMPSDLTSTVPHTGWRDDGAVVAAIRGGDTGLRPGDLVMAIDGSKLTDRAVPRASVGQRLQYRVRRGGRIIDVPVTLRPYPFRQALAANWSTIVFAALLLVLGGDVFARRPALAPARVRFMTGCLYGCASASFLFGPEVLDAGLDGVGWWMFLGGALAVAFFWPAVIHFAL